MLEIDPLLAGDATDRLLDPSDTRPGRQRALRSWLEFQARLCLSPEQALALLDVAGGDPARAVMASRPASDSRGGARTNWPATLARLGVRALPITSPAYPPLLRVIGDAAPLLLVAGNPEVLARPGVAIVGARAATAYGLGVARELAAGLARAGLTVVSGMARGIDAAAHRGALEAGGATVAVQACGPDRTYPPEHRNLRQQICAAGAVVTELPLGYPPRGPFFPLRNRLISGLVQLVIVVEARERSGSLITARHALDQGREVMALPGPISAPTSSGPNRLLRDGARPVLELADVLDCLGWQPPEDTSLEESSRGPSEPLAPDAAEILQRLQREPVTRDELAQRLGRPPEQLALRLLELELGGWLSEDRDGRLRPVPRSALGDARIGRRRE